MSSKLETIFQASNKYLSRDRLHYYYHIEVGLLKHCQTDSKDDLYFLCVMTRI